MGEGEGDLLRSLWCPLASALCLPCRTQPIDICCTTCPTDSFTWAGQGTYGKDIECDSISLPYSTQATVYDGSCPAVGIYAVVSARYVLECDCTSRMHSQSLYTTGDRAHTPDCLTPLTA